jgi:outer membrane protein assembly factor BamB
MPFSLLGSRLLIAASLVLGSLLPAANWPQWRGPTFNGASPETDIPTTFSRTKNVTWSTPLPGPSAATPIVWEDRVFVSSTDATARALLALGVDRKTGSVLWQEKVSDGFGRDHRSNYSAPSPVTDGQRVIFFYGNGVLVAFDFNGRELWRRNLEKEKGAFATQWTFAASPLLHQRRLYIQVLQRDVPVGGRGRKGGPIESYLLALDPVTGKTQWEQVRPSKAKAESREAFTTPTPVQVGDRLELLVAGGDCLTGHDAASGIELWRWGTYNPTRIGHWRLVPSPVVAGGAAILCAPKGAPVYAIRLGLRGPLEQSAVTWESPQREITSDVATPLVYQGKLYVLNGEKRILSRMDPATGQVDWVGELGTRAKIESSPTAADGKIYFMDHDGEVFVVSAGDEFKLLHQTLMGDDADRESRSSIAISGGALFIRTAGRLYCVGP